MSTQSNTIHNTEMSSTSPCGPPNTLMCMDITSLLLSPIHHAYLRSAGSHGFHVYEELVSLHTSILPMHYEVQTNEYVLHPLLPKATYGVPTDGYVDENSALGWNGSSSTSSRSNCAGCLVVSLSAYQHRSLPLPFWREMSSCTSLRIHVSPHNTTTTTTTSSSFLPPRIGMASRANNIELSGFEGTEILPSYFLTDCTAISTLDLSPLLDIKIIHDYFLGCCSNLSHLDLSPLKAVTTIGDGFLHGCARLDHLDFTGCEEIDSIGIGFLASCSSLKTVDLSSLHRIVDIEGSFMKGCSSLTSIDLTPFTNVRGIGAKFLSGCTSLKEIDLAPISQVLLSIDHLFLDRCVGITSLDVSPLLLRGNMTRVDITRAIGSDMAASMEIQW